MATLQEMREAKGWSRAQLEAKTDNAVSQATIWRIEEGKAVPFRGTRIALARALGVTAEDIEWPAKTRTEDGGETE